MRGIAAISKACSHSNWRLGFSALPQRPAHHGPLDAFLQAPRQQVEHRQRRDLGGRWFGWRTVELDPFGPAAGEAMWLAWITSNSANPAVALPTQSKVGASGRRRLPSVPISSGA
jgi:hypothetical protein